MPSSNCASAKSETSDISDATTSASKNGQYGDGVVPTEDELWETQCCSQRKWATLLSRAHEAQKTGLQLGGIHLEKLLHFAPELPQDLENVHAISGRATWRRQRCIADADSNGDLPSATITRVETERHWRLSLPSGRPTLWFLSRESRFSLAHQPANALAPLFLAWTYILSKALLERQNIAVQYTTSPECRPSDQDDPEGHDGHINISIGRATPAEINWWRALVVPGHGWLPLGNKRPPWTVACKGDTRMNIQEDTPKSGKSDSDGNVPPSSELALHYLARFCALHGLDDQAMLSLSMALVLPLLNQSRSEVVLPRPCGLSQNSCPVSRDAAPSPSILSQRDNLARSLTLSSHPMFVSSALWSIFWEPGVVCNHVSAWLRPVHDIVQPLIQDGDIETIAHLFALRCPVLAPLWYGVLACGPSTTIARGIPRFLTTLQAPTISRPLPEVAVWTRSLQSFMDMRGNGPLLQTTTLSTGSTAPSRVERRDIWRLRHVVSDEIEPCSHPFRNPPFCPWPPFGAMDEDEVEPSVRAHLRCDRHIWEYASWIWTISGKEPYEDRGRACPTSLSSSGPSSIHGGVHETYEHSISTTNPTRPLDFTLDQQASQQATGDIFRWAASEMEQSGKNIYYHPWVQAELDLEDMETDGDTVDDGSPTPTKGQEKIQLVEEWLAKQ